jgi:thiol:disulfide interchange protein DsbC
MKPSVALLSLVPLLACIGLALPASQQISQSSKDASDVLAPAAAAAAAAAAATAPAPAAGTGTGTQVAPKMSPLPDAPLQQVSAETLKQVALVAGESIKPEDVRATPVPGVFELRRGPEILYMSQDGRFVFTGDLYRVQDKSNLTEARRSTMRRELIDAIPESKMVIFSPPQPKYTITVFTDVDCPYCQAFHKQIDKYNKLGIRVRYMFFPRSGPDTESWHKAEAIWCSADRKSALTQAKLGKPLTTKACSDTPVAQEYQLGKAVGLEGTPGIVASNGEMLGGYVPPDELADELRQLKP